MGAVLPILCLPSFRLNQGEQAPSAPWWGSPPRLPATAWPVPRSQTWAPIRRSDSTSASHPPHPPLTCSVTVASLQAGARARPPHTPCLPPPALSPPSRAVAGGKAGAEVTGDTSSSPGVPASPPPLADVAGVFLVPQCQRQPPGLSGLRLRGPQGSRGAGVRHVSPLSSALNVPEPRDLLRA